MVCLCQTVCRTELCQVSNQESATNECATDNMKDCLFPVRLRRVTKVSLILQFGLSLLFRLLFCIELIYTLPFEAFFSQRLLPLLCEPSAYTAKYARRQFPSFDWRAAMRACRRFIGNLTIAFWAFKQHRRLPPLLFTVTLFSARDHIYSLLQLHEITFANTANEAALMAGSTTVLAKSVSTECFSDCWVRFR